MNSTIYKIAQSWTHQGGILHSTDDLLEWVAERNKLSNVSISKTVLSKCRPWFYDKNEGTIRNEKRSFFQISGFKKLLPDGNIISQPILLQNEIGYLGILCKEFDGVMHFLMQAKIEPGNVNQIQISPTIQATKSNFTQLHGGKKPAYLDYFLNADKHEIVLDQLQSEQSSRFFGKRNRNIMVKVDEDVEVLPTHRWMTLGQIKALMRYDNLVNMDTRTVLSCIPYDTLVTNDSLNNMFKNKALLNSLVADTDYTAIIQLYHYINNHKMLKDSPSELCPLHTLDNWDMRDDGISCKAPYPFKVVYCDIEIEGREVVRWTQPLFEADGIATFALLMCEDNGVLKFLVKATPELGCFDAIEIGPTLQKEATSLGINEDTVSEFVVSKIDNKEGIVFDHLLSEEGGRFYHEQNRNVLIMVDKSELPALPDGYFWLNYKTLNTLIRTNNVLNIQLRNLLSLLQA